MTTLTQAQLLGLYISQGAPAGFHTTLVPLLFRQWGQSYKTNAMAQLSYLPWVLKPLVAPYYESASVTAVAKTLAVSGIVQLLISLAVQREAPNVIMALLFVANVCTALYDIFVDKLAIKQRENSKFDFANVFQVVGYKLGFMATGGFLLFVTSHYIGSDFSGFSLSPLLAAGILLSMSIWTFVTAPKKTAANSTKMLKGKEKAHRKAYGAIWKHFTQHSALYALLFTYKAGETIGDSLFKPFLRDSGFDLRSLASMNLLNEFVSIAGSLTMIGKSKSDRKGENDAKQLRLFLLLNVIPQCLRAVIICFKEAQQFLPVAGITLVENFIGGAVTVACFNFMFSNVLPGIEGTHYAVFSSVEVLGKIMTGFLANLVVESFGFQHTFLSAIVLSFVPLLLLQMKSVQDASKHLEPVKLF